MGYFGSVRFFKNMILAGIIVTIAVPTGMTVQCSRELKQVRAEVDRVSRELAQKEAGLMPDEPDDAMAQGLFQAESPYEELYPDFYAPQRSGEQVSETGVMYLTFDDGPSERTAKILDILKEKDAKATFFVVGSSSQESKELLRRIVNEGHTLAMHSYSHNYKKIYASVEDYLADMYQIFTQIREETGVTPSLFRFPGGSINGYNGGIYQELIAEMLRRGFVPFDWNISSQDAATNKLQPSGTLVNNVVSGAQRVQRGVVLMHDAAPKTTTVEALGPMIDQLKNQGFELKALTPEVAPVLYGYKE